MLQAQVEDKVQIKYKVHKEIQEPMKLCWCSHAHKVYIKS